MPIINLWGKEWEIRKYICDGNVSFFLERGSRSVGKFNSRKEIMDEIRDNKSLQIFLTEND